MGMPYRRHRQSKMCKVWRKDSPWKIWAGTGILLKHKLRRQFVSGWTGLDRLRICAFYLKPVDSLTSSPQNSTRTSSKGQRITWRNLKIPIKFEFFMVIETRIVIFRVMWRRAAWYIISNVSREYSNFLEKFSHHILENTTFCKP